MMKQNISLGIACFFFLSLTTFGAQQSTAQTYNWGAPGNGVFNSQFNWNPIGVPGATNPIAFDMAMDIEVELTGNHSVRSINKQGSRVTFVGGHRLSAQGESNSRANRLTFSGTGTEFQNSTTMNIGSSMPTMGELWIRGDAFAQTENIVIAPGGSDTGRLVVIDPGSAMNNSGTFTVGDGGDGILFLNLNAELTTASGVVADQPLSSSLAIVTNNSRWDNSGVLILGNQGDANIDITEGGEVTSGSTWVGFSNLSNSTVTVSGDNSLFHVDGLTLGTPSGGVGHLEILQLSSFEDAAVRVGGYIGGSFTNSFMSIADIDSALATVQNGSTISTTDLFVGTATGTNGSLNISGSGSVVEAENAFIMGGIGSPPNDGIGTLEVSDGGKLTAENGFLYNGTVNIDDDGTQLEFESLTLGAGSGSTNVVMESLVQQNEAAVLYVGDDRHPAWSGSNLVVSDSNAAADFSVQAGSTFRSEYCQIGFNAGNSGLITVVGTNSELHTIFSLTVGGPGANGGLETLGGGKVTGGIMRIGRGAGSNGNVTVQGTNAIIDMSRVYVGDGGTGAMTIVLGGVVDTNVLEIADGSSVNLQGGEIRATIENAGDFSLTGFAGSGSSLVTGNVVNEPTGSITIAGTDAVFAGDVENNGDRIRTSSGSCSFAGRLSGASPLTGGGLVRFQGSVEPGNSAGTVNIENDVIFDPPANAVFEIGGTNSSQYDRLLIVGDCELGGGLQIEFVNGHALTVGDSYRIMEVGGNATEVFDGFPEGAIVANNNGIVLRISYVGGDGNDVVLTGEPAMSNIVADSVTVEQGSLARGTIADLATSDNGDFSIRRSSSSVAAITEFTVTATSPTANPDSMIARLEGSVFARTTVMQSIALYNYQTDSFEVVGEIEARRFTDLAYYASVHGDLSRFVEPGSNMMEARVRYRSLIARQRFTSNTDLFMWQIGQ